MCASNLLRALCVNVLERVLRLLLVVPDNVGVLGLLARLGVDALLHRVDVGDVVLPGARRRTPRLLDGLVLRLLGALGARGRGASVALDRRGAALALGALVGLLGPAANVVKVLVQHVGGRLPVLVSSVARRASWRSRRRTCSARAPMCGPWGSRSPAT